MTIPVFTPNQLDHLKKVQNCLDVYGRYINSSVLGSGKTYITCELARRYSLPLLVICPKSVINEWNRIAELFEVKIEVCLTYAALRSKSSVSEPKHKLLTRSNSTFTVTDKFKQMVKDGIIVVFDECHNLKNDSDQFRACVSLSQEIYRSTSSSKLFMLSGTLFDKPEHAIQMIKLLGIIKQETFVEINPVSKSLEWTGLHDLMNHCKSINKRYTNVITYTQTYSKKNTVSTIKNAVTSLVYDLFVKILKPVYIHSMDSTVITQDFVVKNGFYNLENEEKELELKKIIQKLCVVSNYKKKNEDNKTTLNWNLITIQLHEIERCKTNILIRLAKRDLESNPKAKVVLFVNYLDTLETLKNSLKQFSPLVMCGSTSLEDRKTVVSLFQQPSASHRLFIANIATGNSGISLHDLDKNYPRFTYIVPTYSLINMHQASYRTYRHGVKSDTNVRFVYGNILTQETGVLNSLSRKTNVLKSLASENTTQMKMPSDFDSEIEKK